MLKILYSKQMKEYTCGPVALGMVMKFLGKKISEKNLEKKLKVNKKGTSHDNLIREAVREGFYCYVHKNSSINQIKFFIDNGLPVIVNYIEPENNEGHYAIVKGYSKRNLILSDPELGDGFKIKNKDFEKRWHEESHPQNKRWIIVLSKKPFDVGRQYFPLKK